MQELARVYCCPKLSAPSLDPRLDNGRRTVGLENTAPISLSMLYVSPLGGSSGARGDKTTRVRGTNRPRPRCLTSPNCPTGFCCCRAALCSAPPLSPSRIDAPSLSRYPLSRYPLSPAQYSVVPMGRSMTERTILSILSAQNARYSPVAYCSGPPRIGLLFRQPRWSAQPCWRTDGRAPS